MFENARSWRVLAGGVAAGIAGVVGFAGTTASADPLGPQPPAPAPVTVTQTVTVAPGAAATSAPVAGQPASATPLADTSLVATPTLATPTLATPALATPAAPTTPALAPATSVTLTDFLKSKGVKLEPQNARDFRALNITLPVPAGWSQVPDPNVPDAFAVIADRAGGDGLYTSNAQVVVYRLVGDFDPKEAITHGFIDSAALSNWQSTDASLADFGGFPSSMIEGAYRQNDMMLSTSRRHVIANVGPERYLVSLSVTTAFSQAVAAADATDSIVNGFRVTDPAAAPSPTAPVPALPALPALTAQPTPAS